MRARIPKLINMTLSFRETPYHITILPFVSYSEATEGHQDDQTDLDARMDLSGKRVKGFQLIRRQFAALFFKRFHHARRSKKGFGAQVCQSCFTYRSLTILSLGPLRKDKQICIWLLHNLLSGSYLTFC